MHGEVVLVVIGLKPVCVPSNTLCGVILTVVLPVVVGLKPVYGRLIFHLCIRIPLSICTTTFLCEDEE